MSTVDFTGLKGPNSAVQGPSFICCYHYGRGPGGPGETGTSSVLLKKGTIAEFIARIKCVGCLLHGIPEMMSDFANFPLAVQRTSTQIRSIAW